MKKSINPRAIEIQKRFFEAMDIAISLGKISGGLKGFCDEHKFNRTKYQRIKCDLNKPIDEMMYKTIDVDALAALCVDFGVSAEWLLLGKGKMLKPDEK